MKKKGGFMISGAFAWIVLKMSFGKIFIESIFKFSMRNKPLSVKEKYNENGILIEREQIYR